MQFLVIGCHLSRLCCFVFVFVFVIGLLSSSIKKDTHDRKHKIKVEKHPILGNKFIGKKCYVV